MQLSVCTAICEHTGEAGPARPLTEAIRILAGIGYRQLDLDLFEVWRPDFLLCGDNWERRVDGLGEEAARLGVSFYQCHVPFVRGGGVRQRDPRFRQPGYAELFDECMRRSFIASGRLGIQWAVIHPLSCPECNCETGPSLEANRRYFDPFISVGIRSGTGAAFENMLPSLNREFTDRHCQNYEQLIGLADSYGDSMVGICWDTGHANQMQYDQGRALRAVGSRLKALHINDNEYGRKDEHLLPFMGTVDWATVLRTLAETGYSGTLNYETHRVAMRAAGAFQTDLLQATWQNGQHLLELYGKICGEIRNGSRA